MLKKISLILIALTLLFASQNAMACDDLFRLSVETEQQSVISSFNRGDFAPLSLRTLPNSRRSFYVETSRGAVVVRFPDENNDLRFERFASSFQKSINLLTSKVIVTKLPPQLEKAVRDYLKSNPDPELAKNLEAEGATEISVASYFGKPFVLGIDFLVKLNGGAMPPQRELLWHSLNGEMQSALADLWAGYVVLGISDVHPDNWLTTSNGQVAGIDLAMRTTIFERGMEKIKWFLLSSPLGPADMSDAHFQELLSAISLAMRQRLDGLTEEKVAAIAKRDNFQISQQQIKGMLARARLLAKP